VGSAPRSVGGEERRVRLKIPTNVINPKVRHTCNRFARLGASGGGPTLTASCADMDLTGVDDAGGSFMSFALCVRFFSGPPILPSHNI